MSQTTTPSGADVDVLTVFDDCISKLEYHYRDTRAGAEMTQARTAVAALIARNAELEALAIHNGRLADRHLEITLKHATLAADNLALREIPEQIAAGWDGCYYEADPVYGDDNKPLSIGDRIRSSAERRLRAVLARKPAAKENDDG